MLDTPTIEAERPVQTKFSFRTLAASLLLLAVILLYDRWLISVPDREELGWQTARIEFRPVELDSGAFAPLRLVGAWKLTSEDPRLGGISALASDGGRLLALSDSGVLIRFSPPDARLGPAHIGELPGGPGDGRFKRNRDSEALVRDPQGRGWWVAFENRHELWLYDPGFGRALRRIRLGNRGWRANRGVEGLAVQGDSLLLFTERGDQLLRVTGSSLRPIAIAHAHGRISDAAAFGPGQLVAVERRPTPRGFRNALVAVDQTRSGYRFGRRMALPLAPIDNVEAIAVEGPPNGPRRLWLVTDDNLQTPMRTLLIALDWPPARP